jgi:dimethylhistidine N-methyltransferase
MPTSRALKTVQSDFIPDRERNSEAIGEELSAGLLAAHAFISPKYLYDELGSKLFEAICELPEYYLTRTEAAIFNGHIAEIAQAVGSGTTLIDLGAGNCEKAARLFPALQPEQYVAVDISSEFLRGSLEHLQRRFPELPMVGVAQDFSDSLELPENVQRERRLFFYPGSSLGNFTPEQALGFLRRLRAGCGADGGVLIGIDLVKEKKVLDAAYDDALGVTASFNLNLLLHLNRILEADFDLRQWRHRAYFDMDRSRIEMHLEARRNLSVRWRGGERRFAEGERIHTENSYKYTREGVVELLEQAGFDARRAWTDERAWFMVCYARAE